MVYLWKGSCISSRLVRVYLVAEIQALNVQARAGRQVRYLERFCDF